MFSRDGDGVRRFLGGKLSLTREDSYNTGGKNYGFPCVGGGQKRERETQKVRYIQLGRNLRQQEWKAASLSSHYPWALCSSSPV